jgi:hypothetical protein
MRKAAIAWPGYFMAAGIAFLYNDWVLGYLLNPRMSENRSLISELSATSQPYHVVFQSLDITAGIVTLLCAGYIWHLTKYISTQKRWILTGLFLFVGLDSIVDASLPLACAPSLDAACRLINSHSAITQAHLIESNIAGATIGIAPVVWWWQHTSNKHRHLSLASVWLVIIEIAVGLTALIVRFTHHGNYGGIQRIYQGALGVWIGLIVYTALTIHTDARSTRKRAAAAAAASSTPGGDVSAASL